MNTALSPDVALVAPVPRALQQISSPTYLTWPASKEHLRLDEPQAGAKQCASFPVYRAPLWPPSPSSHPEASASSSPEVNDDNAEDNGSRDNEPRACMPARPRAWDAQFTTLPAACAVPCPEIGQIDFGSPENRSTQEIALRSRRTSPTQPFAEDDTASSPSSPQPIPLSSMHHRSGSGSNPVSTTKFSNISHSAGYMDPAQRGSRLAKALEQLALRPDSSDGSRTLTAIMSAAYTGDLIRIEAAIRAGDDVNAIVPGNKYTALMFAAIAGRHDAVLLLLRHGADRFLRNRLGRTAENMAQLAGQQHCVDLLRVHVPHDLFVTLTKPVVPADYRITADDADRLYALCNSSPLQPDEAARRIADLELCRADIVKALDILATAVARSAQNVLVTLRLSYLATLTLHLLSPSRVRADQVFSKAATRAAEAFESVQEDGGWGAERLTALADRLLEAPANALQTFQEVLLGHEML
eukprot:m.54067 g.54067  ORF g.54067 m.54067 type:complete len:470 (+) comp6555_c0_seq1:118-1527(+)